MKKACCVIYWKYVYQFENNSISEHILKVVQLHFYLLVKTKYKQRICLGWPRYKVGNAVNLI